MKPSHIILFIVALLSSILAGFIYYLYNTQTISNTATNQDVVLNMVGYTYTYQQLLPIINSYQKLNPSVQINYTQFPDNYYYNYLIPRMESRTPANIPDLFEADNSDINRFTKFLKVAPESIINTSTFENSFYNIFSRGLIFNKSEIIGLPNNLNSLIIVYNKSLFDKLKLNVSDFSTNINSFNSNIHSVSTTDNINTINIALPSQSSASSDILQLFMLSGGTSMNSVNSPFAGFNNQNGINSLMYYNSFLANGDYSDNSNLIAGNSDISSFANGNTLMMFIYPDMLNEIFSINPNMNLGYFIYPSLSNKVTLGKYDFYGVSSYSQNYIQAWKFNLYLHSEKNLSLLSNNSPESSSYQSSPYVASLSTTQNEFNSTISEANLVAKDWSETVNSETDKEFNDMIINYANGVDINLTLKTAEDAINKDMEMSFNM